MEKNRTKVIIKKTGKNQYHTFYFYFFTLQFFFSKNANKEIFKNLKSINCLKYSKVSKTKKMNNNKFQKDND